MDTSTIIWIIVAVVAVLVIAALIVAMLRQRKTQRRREADEIRTDAQQKSYDVGRQEALAKETAAKARIAAAEADAKKAEAQRLQQQAGSTGSDAAAARTEVDEQWKHADAVDPDVGKHDATPRSEESGTPDTAPRHREGA